MAYFEKAQAAAAPSLGAGEQVQAIARFQAKGQGTAMAVGGIVGAAVQSARTKGDRAAATEAGVTLPPRGVFVVTNQRALIFSQSAFAAKPKKIVAEIPAAQLTSAEVTDKGGLMRRIRLNFPTGGGSHLDIVKKDDVDRLVAALNAVARGAQPPPASPVS
jgi:hypothetical protein